MADKTCVRTTGFDDEFHVGGLVVTPQGVRREDDDTVQAPAGLALDAEQLTVLRNAAFVAHVRLCEEPAPEVPSEEDEAAKLDYSVFDSLGKTDDTSKTEDVVDKPKVEAPATDATVTNTTDTSTDATAPGTTRKAR